MSKKITFRELVELIAKQSEQSDSSTDSFIHELVQIIEGGLKQSGNVSISGFGKFELRWMKERPGINPQTGEEITIPGQNKVIFKPYKALRETVNKPFASLTSRVLPEEEDSKKDELDEKEKIEETDAPFDLDDVLTGEPSASDESLDPDDPFGFEETKKKSAISKDWNKYIDDLIIEKENPHFTPKGAFATADEEDVLVLEQEEAPDEKVVPLLPDESKMAREVQKAGSFRWSYAAAVIMVMIALIILFIMMQRSGQNLEETASADNQTEQIIESPSNETAEEEAAEEPEPTIDEESSAASSGNPPSDELETQSFIVENGQSLWNIADSELGNPYLWPVIYHLNQDILTSPNQLLTSAEIEIPIFSNPDNLSEFEREQVALGYFSLYEWNRENNPDEARYFLWAVGVFSQDLLDQPPSQVDSEDLSFARNR